MAHLQKKIAKLRDCKVAWLYLNIFFKLGNCVMLSCWIKKKLIPYRWKILKLLYWPNLTPSLLAEKGNNAILGWIDQSDILICLMWERCRQFPDNQVLGLDSWVRILLLKAIFLLSMEAHVWTRFQAENMTHATQLLVFLVCLSKMIGLFCCLVKQIWVLLWQKYWW